MEKQTHVVAILNRTGPFSQRPLCVCILNQSRQMQQPPAPTHHKGCGHLFLAAQHASAVPSANAKDHIKNRLLSPCSRRPAAPETPSRQDV